MIRSSQCSKSDFQNLKNYKFIRFDDGEFVFWELSEYGPSHRDVAMELRKNPINAGVIGIIDDSWILLDKESITLRLGTTYKNFDELSSILERLNLDP